jgi:hypothetical protein
MINEKEVEAFQAKLRLSQNFRSEHIFKRTSPFDLLEKKNKADAIEVILKSMYGPHVDDYNWIGLSDHKFETVEKSLEHFLNLRGKWLETEIKKHATRQSVVTNIELIKPPKPKNTFRLSDLPTFVLCIPIAIFLLSFVPPSIPLILEILSALILSPYSGMSAVFFVLFGLVGEAADGFKVGWWIRLLGNWWYGIFIIALVCEFFLILMGSESYFS